MSDDPLRGIDFSERMKPFAQQAILLDQKRMARIAALQDAIKAELTHGGVFDETAQCSMILGLEVMGLIRSSDPKVVEQANRIFAAAERLDAAREEFRTRMEAALDGDQHG